MAVFLNNHQSLIYHIDKAPFVHDLVLLQDSGSNRQFWLPVLEDFGAQASHAGRVLTCDWPVDVKVEDLASHFLRLVQTLALHNVHVVAFNDAVAVVDEIQNLQLGTFERTLLFPQGGPRGEEMVSAIRAFCGI